MKRIIGLYGKTWHFWEVDKGHELPLGRPRLMGSMNEGRQTNLDEALKDRNKRFDFGSYLETQANAGSKGLENVWTPQARVQKASLIESEGGEGDQAQWWCGLVPLNRGGTQCNFPQLA
jgi:hypothetical protein